MGRKLGEAHKKSNHLFKVELLNKIADKWEIYGEYPTIRKAGEALGYSYHVIQNIRLNRHRTLCPLIRITRDIN